MYAYFLATLAAGLVMTNAQQCNCGALRQCVEVAGENFHSKMVAKMESVAETCASNLPTNAETGQQVTTEELGACYEAAEANMKGIKQEMIDCTYAEIDGGICGPAAEGARRKRAPWGKKGQGKKGKGKKWPREFRDFKRCMRREMKAAFKNYRTAEREANREKRGAGGKKHGWMFHLINTMNDCAANNSCEVSCEQKQVTFDACHAQFAESGLMERMRALKQEKCSCIHSLVGSDGAECSRDESSDDDEDDDLSDEEDEDEVDDRHFDVCEIEGKIAQLKQFMQAKKNGGGFKIGGQ